MAHSPYLITVYIGWASRKLLIIFLCGSSVLSYGTVWVWGCLDFLYICCPVRICVGRKIFVGWLNGCGTWNTFSCQHHLRHSLSCFHYLSRAMFRIHVWMSGEELNILCKETVSD